MNNKIILAVVVVAVGAAGFFSGIKYDQGRTSSRTANLGQRFGQNSDIAQRRGGANGAGFLVGDILSRDDQSMTLKMRDGGSRIVLLSSSTAVDKTASGSLDDLVVGKSVSVQGVTNPDGSVTAQTIILQRAMMLRLSPSPTK